MIGAAPVSAPARTLTAVDLFAGAGGATEGLSRAGFRVLAAVENDADAVRTFEANHEDVRVLAEDIENVSPEELRQALGLARRDLTLLTACPPCQGFSTLGTRRRDDARNDLVAEVWRFARALLPEAVLVENVPGLVNNARWDDLCSRLRDSSYQIRHWIVDAADFGVPQRRRRLIAIAVREDATTRLPDDLHEALPAPFRREPAHARDAMAAAGPVEGTEDRWHRPRNLTPAVLERVRAIPPGGDHYDLPEDLQLECHKRLSRRGRTASTGPYSRMSLDGPAPTMTTRCTTVSCGRFIHPTEDRGISLREAALLQTFPVDYQFVGSHESVERQIGNAVPVALAHALGIAIRNILTNESCYA